MPDANGYPDYFARAVQQMLDVEGGYADHADDPGGKTRYGITEAVARRAGYQGRMQYFGKEQAIEIYHRHYWKPLRLTQVAALDWGVAWELFDIGVNMGTNRAAEWLQRALNALNRQGSDYNDIAEDGIIGPVTIRTLKAYLEVRRPEGAEVLMALLNSRQGTYYWDLAERRQASESFLYGWIRERVL